MDKLETVEAQREKESENQEHKPMILPETQLMITAGPAMGIPQQYAAAAAQGYGAGYAQNLPYQGYSGM